MKKHIIYLDELREWRSEEKVIYASSFTPNKKLYVTFRGSYEVWHNGEKILETMHPFAAVEKYNSI